MGIFQARLRTPYDVWTARGTLTNVTVEPPREPERAKRGRKPAGGHQGAGELHASVSLGDKPSTSRRFAWVELGTGPFCRRPSVDEVISRGSGWRPLVKMSRAVRVVIKSC